MRKFLQQKVFSLLETLREAQREGLYAECQNGALGVGELIENIEGEGTQTVALLEEYCELLYRVSVGEAEPKQLNGQLSKVERSVGAEFAPDRIEIAFISYKASMSDSLESIYIAAKADPQCDAYWIPVPYFVKKPDGALGHMYYEGAEHYGEGIDITDWREYSLEARRPDIIFTFNPYDNYNYVTSIHPDFYCERMRGFTDLLVYVPYFVAFDGVEEPFCRASGCINAHRVVVQSEKIRQSYISRLRPRFANDLDQLETRFVALGSPKYDKVISTGRDSCELPSSWAQLLEGRKAVLFNTSISPALQWGGQYLKKLRHVADLFRSRTDVVLWWRPHPLIESTYASMRPDLLREYNKIVSEYKRGGWAIYDDTPDLHRAIAWTDMYYGDISSLVPMYSVTGKPMMIADAGVAGRGPFMLPGAMLDDGNGGIWCSAQDFNGLFRIDKANWKVAYMGSFPGERMSQKWLHIDVAAYGTKLLFLPANAEGIGEYDTETGEFRQIPIPPAYVDGKEVATWRFSCGALHGGALFMYPAMYPAIVKYDCGSGELTVLDAPINELQAFAARWPENIGMPLYFKGIRSFATPQLFVDVCWRTDRILEFDMGTERWKVYRIGDGLKYDRLITVGDGHWLFRFETMERIKWKPGQGVVARADGLPEGYVASPQPEQHMSAYQFGYEAGGHIWFMPCLANMALKFDAGSGEASIIETLQAKYSEIEKNGATTFSNQRHEGDAIYFNITGGDGGFYEFLPLSEELHERMLLPKDKEAVGGLAKRIVDAGLDEARIGRTLESKWLPETACVTISEVLDYGHLGGVRAAGASEGGADAGMDESYIGDGVGGTADAAVAESGEEDAAGVNIGKAGVAIHEYCKKQVWGI